MSLKDKLTKGGSSKYTSVLTASKFFNEKDNIRTRVPLLNIALSGKIDGGLSSGLTVLAGPSKHFKTNMGLIMVSAYLKKYPDAICLFYDSEFGVTPSYLKEMGVDPDRVVHTPIKHVEELKFDISKQLENITREDKVIILIDSIGNLASKKELEDAQNEKSVADMSRAKSIKSLFRIVTPYLTFNDIPCIAINHTYETQEMFSKTVMSGGTGIAYSADTTFIIGRRQIKEGKEVEGYEFVINVDKSRYVREKSKLPIAVTFEGGINTFSGMLEIAQELGFVVKPSNVSYCRVFLNETTGEMEEEEQKFKKKELNSIEFWSPLFKHGPFREAITNRYALGAKVENNEELEKEVSGLFD